MDIRTVRPADAGDVQRVSAASMRTAYEPLVEDETLIEEVEADSYEASVREWFESLPRDGVAYRVAECDDEVVGFCQVLWGEQADEPYVGDGDVLLHALYVHPDHWGEGVGTELLDATLAASPADRDRVVLSVLPDNDRATSFYRSRGFSVVGDGVYEIGGVEYDTVVMARASS